jgi:hypothetical protein
MGSNLNGLVALVVLDTIGSNLINHTKLSMQGCQRKCNELCSFTSNPGTDQLGILEWISEIAIVY